MSRDIYSFVKINRDETDKGVIYSAIGGFTILCLLILFIASFAGGGNLPLAGAAVGYLSFVISGFGLYLSVKLHEDTQAYGRMVDGCLYVNAAAFALHCLIFLIGCFISIS